MNYSKSKSAALAFVVILTSVFWMMSCVKKEVNDVTNPGVPEVYGTGGKLATVEEIKAGVPFSQVAPEILGNRPLVSLPKRHELFMVEPGNQNPFQSCTGWAVGYAAFSHHIKRIQVNSSYVESNIMSPIFIWNSLNNGKDEGISIPAALKFLISDGTCRYETMPYQEKFSLLPDNIQRAEAKNYRIDNFLYFNNPNLDSFKAHLAITKQPLVFIARIDNNFKRAKVGSGFTEVEEGRLVYTSADPSSKDYHTMTLVGYDDGINAFKVMNSWGKSWGNAGYIWIRYDAFLQMLCESGDRIPEIYGLWTMSKDDINKELIAYYQFNNDVFDLSGNRKHGVSSKEVSYADGKKHVAVALAGKCTTGFCEGEEGGHILLPDLGLAQRKKFTINMWVNETRMEIHDGEAYIFFGNHETGMIEISHLSDRLYFSVSRTNSLSVPFDYGDIGKFVMYSLVYDDGVMRAYRNATLLGEATGPVQVTDTTAAIGRHWWWSTSTRFTGAIDEVKIFSAALSPAQLKALFDNP